MPQSDTMRDRAVTLAQQGFRVFKLRIGSKLPAIEDWPNQATNDPEKVHDAWSCPATGESLDNNIGLLTDGLLVLDVDTKNGKQGVQSLESLTDLLGLSTETRASVSPTGGQHLFYKKPPGLYIPSRAEVLGSGLDIRSDKGFVVAAGSIIGGVPYRWTREQEPLDAPEWLLKACAAGPRPVERDVLPLVDLDEPDAIRRSIEWLVHRSPKAIYGQGGDTTTFRVACRVKDFGISEPQCAELMRNHWNEAKAHPIWDPGELADKVAHAYKYGKLPPGIASAAADFEAVEIDVGHPRESLANASKAPPGQLRAYNFTDARDAVTTNDYLIKGLLNQKNMAVIYGAPGSGKTFVALDMAYSIARGAKFQGRRTQQGLVVYFALEGQDRFKNRLAALHRHRPVGEGARVPLRIVHGRLNVRLGADMALMKDQVRAAEAEFGVPCRLIIVDTLSQAAPGFDENSSKEMSEAISSGAALSQHLGCTFAYIHHTGKNAKNGPRGHSVLSGNIDTSILVEPGFLTAGKERDEETGVRYRFRLKVLELGRDQDGDPIRSCVIEWLTASEFERLELTPVESTVFEAIDLAIYDACEETGAAPADFDFDIAFVKENVSDVSHSHLYRHMKAIVEKAYLKKIKHGRWALA